MVNLYFNKFLFILASSYWYSLIYIYFFETVVAIRGRPIFQKKSYISASENRILQFFQTLIRMKAIFRYSKIVFLYECFIMDSGNGL